MASKDSAGKKARKRFKLSNSIRAKLPPEQRDTAEDLLWEKSSGLCALCGRALGGDPSSIECDHRLAEAAGGKTTLENLYLAHKSCNATRQDLPWQIAVPLVRFKVFCDEKKAVTFDDVLEEYVSDRNADVVFSENTARAHLRFGSKLYDAPMHKDPATGVPYFFAEVPLRYVKNDREIQPRLIMYPHVRKLALDFRERPVHEPSNCRLVETGKKTVSLLQFDGQHKTTAQILLGRAVVPMKIYVKPEIPMLQKLVLKIQQEIKKQPLTKSDTLAKLGDVMQRIIEDYHVPSGEIRTEKGLITGQPREQQREVRRQYFEELQRIIFFDEDNRLASYVKPGAISPPASDKVIIERVIKPLIHSDLLRIDMDAQGGRDNERQAILTILNTIAEKMLPDGLNRPGMELEKIRATNFFYAAAINWWMQEVLLPALRWALYRVKGPLFIDPLEPAHEDRMITVVQALCTWPIWSRKEPEVLKALRSNTVENVKQVFEGWDDRRLLKDSGLA